jgi:hypothetical protein
MSTALNQPTGSLALMVNLIERLVSKYPTFGIRTIFVDLGEETTTECTRRPTRPGTYKKQIVIIRVKTSLEHRFSKRI